MDFVDAYEKTQQKPFLVDMFYLCNKYNKNTFHDVLVGKSQNAIKFTSMLSFVS